MTILLLANVGNRDLTLDARPLAAPRPDGERLLEAWDQNPEEVASRLHMPLLAPLLEHVRRWEGRIDEVVLYATDQPPAVAPQYRDKDTLHAAELIKRLIERNVRPTSSGKRFVYIRSVRANPADYDEMFAHFQRDLEYPSFRRPAIARCYVALVGGTPAANLGLLFAAVRRFGDRCHPLYLKEGASQAQPLDLAHQLREATLCGAAARQVANYQFAAAAETLEALRDPPFPLIALAKYAQCRLNFDFEGAWRTAMEGLARSSGDTRRHLERAVEEVARLQHGEDDRRLIAELGENLRVAFKTGAYLYFLAGVVRFEEAAARLVVERYLPLDFADDDPPARKRRAETIHSELPDLASFLQESFPSLDDVGRSNTAILLALFHYLVAERPTRPAEQTPDPAEHERLHAVYQVLRRLADRVNPVRNKSVVAHGYVGASREELERAYEAGESGCDGLLADLRNVVDALVPATELTWHVDAVRDFLIHLLGEGGGERP